MRERVLATNYDAKCSSLSANIASLQLSILSSIATDRMSPRIHRRKNRSIVAGCCWSHRPIENYRYGISSLQSMRAESQMRLRQAKKLKKYYDGFIRFVDEMKREYSTYNFPETTLLGHDKILYQRSLSRVNRSCRKRKTA